MLTLTLRGLATHKRRLVSTVVAILLGVAFMAGSMVFTDTMRASLAGVFADAEQGPTRWSAGRPPSRASAARSTSRCDESLVDEVAAVPASRTSRRGSRASPRSSTPTARPSTTSAWAPRRPAWPGPTPAS